ncbi:MAG: low-specificity L-threonine aldolase [Candidatus Marinimicrobia bacterium]|nr:low-specificity L-threonine aldolase [Candidatus Neomarinimicrobiota bacterium]MCF7880282.1 low-specificity L-threonine aldolase [Candidatus Neomarinimicrobiota bacterium]
MIDLRSDTVTKPSEAMRKAMAAAEVGDDVFAEDPTINALQEYCADLLGKDRALYVPSGTMANQTSLNAHTQPGDEVICENGCHIFNYESGAPALLSGIQLNPLPGNHGLLSADQVEAAIRPGNVHHASTKVVALENTHNRAGGVIYPLETIREIAEVARNHDLIMHLDGARLMNAVVAAGINPKEYTQYFDSVTLCFSKGLGAPVGSIVAGNADFIQRVHRYRKIYGGGMRQAGIIAAGALYAIQNNVERLAEDHQNANRLAEGIAGIDEIGIDPEWVQTNIVIFDVDPAWMTAKELCHKLGEQDILLLPMATQKIRAVTNLMVSKKDMEKTISTIQDLQK